MRSSCSLRQEFLKKWIMGLQRCSFPKKNMSIMERKTAIKLSADVALASTRKSTTCWSRALIANAVKQGNDDEKHLVEQMLGPNPIEASMASNKRIINIKRRSKKIVKRSCGIRRGKCGAQAQAARARSIAKRLVKKRREILRNLIPGGEFMNNEVSLIEETLDYIISLRAQVDVMRSLACASEMVNLN